MQTNKNEINLTRIQSAPKESQHTDASRSREPEVPEMVMTVMTLALLISTGVFLLILLFQGNGAQLFSTGIDHAPAEAAPIRIAATSGAEDIIASVSIDHAPSLDTKLSRAFRNLLTESPEDEILYFQDVDASYFDDALFIGDSRTIGLRDYGTLKNATYFADEGIGTYTVMETYVDIPGYGVIGLADLLQKHHYEKIYLMLGINEVYMDVEKIVGRYGRLVGEIRSLAPDSLLFLQANLYVTYAYSLRDSVFDNDVIRYLNEQIALLADDKTTFYLNVNPLFDDGWGNLFDEYTGDGAHVYGSLYKEWCEWLMTKGIVKPKKVLEF